MGRSEVESKQSVQSPEVGVSVTMYDELTTAPTPCSHE